MASLIEDLKRLKRLIKKSWMVGVVLGLVCHFVPPEYQKACRAVTDACSNLVP